MKHPFDHVIFPLSGSALLGMVAISYMHACMLSCFSHVQLCATLWTVARQAPLSVGFSRQEYWSGLPYPPPGDLPTPEIEPVTHVSCTDRQVSYHERHLRSIHESRNEWAYVYV